MALLNGTKYCTLLDISVTLELSLTSLRIAIFFFNFVTHLKRVAWCEGDVIQGEINTISCLLI